MTPELKTAWIAALRSGAFRQVKGRLREPGFDGQSVGHCCLGVLCEVAGLHQDSHGYRDQFGVYSGLALNEGLARELGLDQSPLWKMNDREGKTFAEIADWIESHDLASGEELPSSSKEPASAE